MLTEDPAKLRLEDYWEALESSSKSAAATSSSLEADVATLKQAADIAAAKLLGRTVIDSSKYAAAKQQVDQKNSAAATEAAALLRRSLPASSDAAAAKKLLEVAASRTAAAISSLTVDVATLKQAADIATAKLLNKKVIDSHQYAIAKQVVQKGSAAAVAAAELLSRSLLASSDATTAIERLVEAAGTIRNVATTLYTRKALSAAITCCCRCLHAWCGLQSRHYCRYDLNQASVVQTASTPTLQR